VSDDELPEESHRLARKWLDMIGADIVAHGDSLVTYHALSILFVSLVGQWVRAQPCVTKVEVILQHVAALTVEGIEVGIELWNGDHPGERIEVSPKPSYLARRDH
jgi:hypothetical protein